MSHVIELHYDNAVYARHSEGTITYDDNVSHYAVPLRELYALRPYSLQRMLRGCKVLSARDSGIIGVTQNLTGLPAPKRQAAIAIINLMMLADERAEHESRGSQ